MRPLGEGGPGSVMVEGEAVVPVAALEPAVKPHSVTNTVISPLLFSRLSWVQVCISEGYLKVGQYRDRQSQELAKDSDTTLK